jgi:HlyD family secretion protein
MTTLRQGIAGIDVGELDFAPAILGAQHAPPPPFPRLVLYTLLVLFGVLLVWAIFGKLDIVAVAQGKLVPETFLKVVQPSDAGVIKEILVKEGDQVGDGQVLMRMDTSVSAADRKVLDTDFQLKALQLRRIDAELQGAPLARRATDDATLFAQVDSQYRARRQAYLDALDTERAASSKANHDLKSAIEVESKLRQTLPIYREQEKGWNQLAQEGFAGKLMALDRTRSRIETEQELNAQIQNVESLKANIAQSNKRISQIMSNYQQQLHNERVEAESQHNKLSQELAKHSYRHGLLELRAPQAGIVKDLATHTPGTVVSPGTVMLTIVPHNEPLLAEVWINNADAGFVGVKQKVRIKLDAYPFQKYGMLDGMVRLVTHDASERGADAVASERKGGGTPPQGLAYRALVALDSGGFGAKGQQLKLTPGMQVAAEIHLGQRSVIEYLLSPIQKVAQEAGRER